MKNIHIIVVFCLFGVMSFDAQNISQAEYFFDSDPGVGNGIEMSVDTNSGDLDQTFSIPTTGLLSGFHSFYIRTQNNNGNWGLYDRSNVYVTDFINAISISAAEYFFDSDPGIGNGNAISINTNSGNLAQSFVVSTNGLSQGFHSFHIRTQNDIGNWSLYDRTIMYFSDFLGASPVVLAEYFFDEDPSVGNGITVVFDDSSQSTQTILAATTGLSQGLHTFYVRVQREDGQWSIYDSETFLIDGVLGQEESTEPDGLILFPNPVSDILVIEAKNTFDKIEIYDMQGKLIKELDSKSYEQTINLSFLKVGLYLVQLKFENENILRKFIKK